MTGSLMSLKVMALAIMLFLIQSSDQPTPTISDGYGDCPAFQHSHQESPGHCFDDDDHDVTARRTITITAPDPNDEAVTAALADNADILAKWNHVYAGPDYFLARYEDMEQAAVREDFKALQTETDHAAFLALSKRLADDYGLLDALDDMLRREDVI